VQNNSSCAFTLTFTPTALGAAPATTLDVKVGTASPLTLVLTGAGH
jgi:hypothetical protein